MARRLLQLAMLGILTLLLILLSKGSVTAEARRELSSSTSSSSSASSHSFPGPKSSSRLALSDEDETGVEVEVDGSSPAATVGEGFVCATLDWWPASKCDYGTCSWQPRASILNLDLSSPLLHNALKAFSPLKIRLGGTLQDQVVYHVGQTIEPCLPFTKNQSVLFGFSGGCLPMWRWNQLNTFFQRVGCEVVFGLNALYGRTGSKHSQGAWDSSNARDFIQYTFEKGYKIMAWEFGNELSGQGVGTKIDAEQYAKDVLELLKILGEIYVRNSSLSRPLLVSPDGFFDKNWTIQFLKYLSREGCTIDVFTRHIYNLGPGVATDLVEKILDPSYLSNEWSTFQAVQDVLTEYGSQGIQSWVGEAGGAYNSGHHLVTDAFLSSFWYLDQLGMAASFGTKAYCRQSLVGGNYGLLNTTTFVPNPDYYGALLWHRLMGTKVLKTISSGSSYLRAYAHCSKRMDGTTLLLLNLSNKTTYTVSPSITHILSVKRSRLEYHLTPKGGDFHSQVVMLNGVPLEVNSQSEIPTLIPQVVDNEEPLLMKPLSIAFVSILATIPACSSS